MFPIKVNLSSLFCLIILLVVNCHQVVADELDEDIKHPLGREDFENGEHLDKSQFAINDKVLYSGKLFEGDIAEDLTMMNGDPEVRNGLVNSRTHWPNGKVPYIISHEFNGNERAIIAHAMQQYHTKTCIRFAPYANSDPNYIHLVKGSGCSSRVGMVGGVQEVTLGEGCVNVGIVEHELMHALGFVHEQSRTDRDQYVRVNFQNIRRGLESNFAKYSVDEISALGEPYDYGSVLHYGSTAFTNGNGPTIQPLKGGAEIGQRSGLSQIDLAKINKLYKCSGRQASTHNNRQTFGGVRPNFVSRYQWSTNQLPRVIRKKFRYHGAFGGFSGNRNSIFISQFRFRPHRFSDYAGQDEANFKEEDTK